MSERSATFIVKRRTQICPWQNGSDRAALEATPGIENLNGRKVELLCASDNLLHTMAVGVSPNLCLGKLLLSEVEIGSGNRRFGKRFWVGSKEISSWEIPDSSRYASTSSPGTGSGGSSVHSTVRYIIITIRLCVPGGFIYYIMTRRRDDKK